MKINLAAAFSVFLLAVLLFGTQSFAVDGQALPTPYHIYHRGDPNTTVYSPKQVDAPNGTKTPTITILQPINNTVITQNTTALTFDLVLEASNSIHPITLGTVCYQPSWQPNMTFINLSYPNPIVNKTFQLTVNVTDIPEGPQSITIYASAMCEYETSRKISEEPASPSGFIVGKYLRIYADFYLISGSSTVNFTLDTSPPTPTPSIAPDNSFNQILGSNTLPYIASVAGIVAFAVLVLLYAKKRQRNKSQSA